MKMPSVMRAQHNFSTVPRVEMERSQFDRSHAHKTTLDAGFLVPIYVDEVLPGDTFHMKLNGFCRLATPLKPLMDNMYVDTFFFFVPNRLLWTNWQKFNGEQINPGDSTSFTIPQATVPGGGYASGSVEDYFGLPIGIAGFSHSALPLRAYKLIFNQWFRDENLVTSYVVSTGDGPDVAPPGGTGPERRGKRHDYFTSCLPWPQKGTAVTFPLSGNAPVFAGTGLTAIGIGVAGSPNVPNLLNDAGVNNIQRSASVGGTPLQADLSAITAVTINELRQAFQVQRLLERDARGGTRYTEIIKAHFGVTSPDARLQRPEYLGGGSAPVFVSPVAQNSSTDVTTPQGNLAGIGTGSWMGHGFVKSFTEHGILMGIMCVRAEQTYQQGLDRMWSRLTRYDHYWPALAHIGEQAVLNKEIYCQGVGADNSVFGYQERYAEYRYKPSRISGLFRSQAAGTLDIWHLAQEFTALPVLNTAFIQENPPVDRVIAVPSEPHFLMDLWFDLKCARPMPVFGVPGMIDHF